MIEPLRDVEYYILFILYAAGPMNANKLIDSVKDGLHCSKNCVIRALKRMTRENELICRAPPDWSNHKRVWYCYYTDSTKMSIIQGIALGIIHWDIIFYTNHMSHMFCIEPKPVSEETTDSLL